MSETVTVKEKLWRVHPLLERLLPIVALVREERTVTAAHFIKKLAIDLDKQGLAEPLKEMLEE
ncbi:hypothetical protein MUP79_09790 [Candidatus Bathyarchaeota archaeon]|nr:hypothetical protein [Candidatus Bathyarchaeota archaeon]